MGTLAHSTSAWLAHARQTALRTTQGRGLGQAGSPLATCCPARQTALRSTTPWPGVKRGGGGEGGWPLAHLLPGPHEVALHEDLVRGAALLLPVQLDAADLHRTSPLTLVTQLPLLLLEGFCSGSSFTQRRALTTGLGARRQALLQGQIWQRALGACSPRSNLHHSSTLGFRRGHVPTPLCFWSTSRLRPGSGHAVTLRDALQQLDALHPCGPVGLQGLVDQWFRLLRDIERNVRPELHQDQVDPVDALKVCKIQTRTPCMLDTGGPAGCPPEGARDTRHDPAHVEGGRRRPPGKFTQEGRLTLPRRRRSVSVSISPSA